MYCNYFGGFIKQLGSRKQISPHVLRQIKSVKMSIFSDAMFVSLSLSSDFWSLVSSSIFTILSSTASSINPFLCIHIIPSFHPVFLHYLIQSFPYHIKAVKRETKLSSAEVFQWRLSHTKFYLNPPSTLGDEIRRWTEIETNMTSLLQKKQRKEGKERREKKRNNNRT
jgi:hypothetical protein